MTRLIVNADDFGVTPGVNRAIRELHAAGTLTSSSLMARAAATEQALQIAFDTPSLGIGCHIVLVDGEPVLSPRAGIPNLADPVSGQFRASLSEFLSWVWGIQGQRFRPEEIEAEAGAQIHILQSRGLRLTHIDTHKHTHMFPPVLRPVLRAARAAGILAVRNPFEPAWSVRATPHAPWLRRAQVSLLRRALESRFRRIVAEEGFVTTDGAIGVLATGTLDAETLASLLSQIPTGTWELVTHPGYHDGDLDRVRTRLKSSREMERTALGALQHFPGLDLISFAGLTAASEQPAEGTERMDFTQR